MSIGCVAFRFDLFHCVRGPFRGPIVSAYFVNACLRRLHFGRGRAGTLVALREFESDSIREAGPIESSQRLKSSRLSRGLAAIRSRRADRA
jgi:hypothetical protein